MFQDNFKKGKDFFNDFSFIDKKCPGCGSKINYGITTEWNDDFQSHACKNCGSKIE